VTHRPSLAAFLAGLLLALCGPTLASEVVAVGRVSIELPGQGWQVYGVNDRGNTMAGGSLTRQQQTETKILLRRAADQTIDAVLMVRANVTGKGRFSRIVYPDASCEGGEGAFSEGDAPGPAVRSFRCLMVLPPGAVTVPDALFQDIQGELHRDGWRLAPAMHLVVAKQYAQTGAFVDLMALVAPEALPALPGASDLATDVLPTGVSATSVQWGRQLQKAVTDSVFSVRARLPVPELLMPSDAPSRSN